MQKVKGKTRHEEAEEEEIWRSQAAAAAV